VRGRGLIVGIEFVNDRTTLAPEADLANQVVEEMKERRILLSTDRLLHNVIKIKPPLVFNEENAEVLANILDETLFHLGF
jgi:4-aminobutyrate aminotransferase-like enzyme